MISKYKAATFYERFGPFVFRKYMECRGTNWERCYIHCVYHKNAEGSLSVRFSMFYVFSWRRNDWKRSENVPALYLLFGLPWTLSLFWSMITDRLAPWLFLRNFIISDFSHLALSWRKEVMKISHTNCCPLFSLSLTGILLSQLVILFRPFQWQTRGDLLWKSGATFLKSFLSIYSCWHAW